MTDEQKKSAPKKAPATDNAAAAKGNKKALAKNTETEAKPAPKTGRLLTWFAIILILVASAVGYWAFIQLKQSIDQLSVDTTNSEKNTSQLAQNMRSSSDQLSALTTQLKALQRESNEQINLLQKQVGKNKRQWLIAEAEYLTRLANTRLRLVGDVDTAIIALQAADQRLKENGDPSTFTVREQLAKEIHALNSVTLPDIVGISSQLLALESALSHLPISDPHAGRAQAAEIGKGEPSPMPENIQQTLNDAWQNFSKLIVVRRHDKPLAAMMTPEQVELIRKNLALKLEAARLALIRGDEALYTASIDISIQWLSAYFDNDQPSVKSALDQLNRLKNTAITVSLPTIDTSLKLLRDIPLMAISEQAPISPKTVDTAIDVKE